LPNPSNYYHTRVKSLPHNPFGIVLGVEGSKGFPEQQGILQN